MDQLQLSARTAIKCHEFLHKTYAPDCFPQLSRDPLPVTAQQIADTGMEFEALIVSKIQDFHTHWVEISDEVSTEVATEQTLQALLDPKVTLIFQPILGTLLGEKLAAATGTTFAGTIRSGRPDFVVCVDRTVSRAGLWIPIDVKSHKSFSDNKASVVCKLDLNELTQISALVSESAFESKKTAARLIDDDVMQLAHYHRLLTELGLSHPDAWAGIIGSDGTLAVGQLTEQKFGNGGAAKSGLDRYDEKFSVAVDIVQQSIARNSDPRLPPVTLPLYVDDAKYCPNCTFRTSCLEQMKNFDGSSDASLLAGITRSNIDKLPTRSMRVLAEGGADIPAEVAQKARVYISGTPEVLIGATLDVPKFDIEIDIDLENSVAVAGDIGQGIEPDVGRLYLYGHITLDRTISQNLHGATVGSFEDYTNTLEGEHAVYLQMWNYLQNQIAQAQGSGKTIGVFHYSHHERNWWNRWVRDFSDLTGTPSQEAMDDFLNSHFIDLRKYAEKVAFPPKKSPVCNYSIKTLAPFANFSWRLDDAGGAMSTFKYRQAISGVEDIAKEAQDWLREYNEDDVKATMAFRHWLVSNFSRETSMEVSS